jgi:hypothetical protein
MGANGESIIASLENQEANLPVIVSNSYLNNKYGLRIQFAAGLFTKLLENQFKIEFNTAMDHLILEHFCICACQTFGTLLYLNKI